MQKVLFLLSEYGYWGEELVGPMEELESNGILIDFITPTGKKPHALPPSMDPTFIDPPLGKTVVSETIAEKVAAIEHSSLLDKPLNLAKMYSQRPYLSSPLYLREFEEYNDKIDKTAIELEKYSALLIVGGSGPIIDLANNQRVHELILTFYRKDKPIAAECNGVACLAFAREFGSRKSIIKGKRVTGHPLEYDYNDGMGFYGTNFVIGPPPYPLEYILRDAVGDTGEFIGNVGKNTSAIVDYPFITGRTTNDSYKTGELLAAALNNGLRRYGF